MRSSIEGLNQEIEGLVLKSTNSYSDSDHMIEDKYARYREQITPEGHRAPLADLLRATRSVNTQTPATDMPSSSYSSGGSRGSTPEQEKESRLGTSPHINRFLAREPPDGCEKVHLKFTEDSRIGSNKDIIQQWLELMHKNYIYFLTNIGSHKYPATDGL
ncbi:protein FAM117B-like isoform X2 [Belonocnema kinseyi]|uniref:protein FAM117B-like isoform X2 n=1 Tax=Belonocnema kinseyi TaxID=2817044 RepID=UPI00143DFE84|nr:protein FAM117B-like isoform X2 [Belonocnema kinseyi]